eukprot:Pgem_evm1s7441
MSKIRISYEDDTPLMLQCEICPTWIHAKCCGLTVKMYDQLDSVDGESKLFFCVECCKKVTTRKKEVIDLLNFVGANPNKYMRHVESLSECRNKKALATKQCRKNEIKLIKENNNSSD